MSEFIELIKRGKTQEATELFNGVIKENESLKVVFYNEAIQNMEFCSAEFFNGISDFISEKMANVAIPRAVASGNLDIVKMFYQKSPAKELDVEMLFSMYDCAVKGRYQTLLYLYDIYGDKALTPHVIYEIIKQDNLKLFQLIEDKFPVIKENNQAHLTFAIKNASFNMIEYFLANGAEIDPICQYLIFLAQMEDPRIGLTQKFQKTIEILNKHVEAAEESHV